MIEALFEEKEEAFARPHTPFLSHSRINRYLHCPEQYRLYYVENLRPKAPGANLVFGQIVHHALAILFNGQGEPISFFTTAWDEVRSVDLTYAHRDTWDKLNSKGQLLLEKFLSEGLQRLQNIGASEKVFRLHVTGFDIPIVGVIDLIADLDGKRTVLDFKTSGSAYEDHEVILSDQLTAYQLAELFQIRMAGVPYDVVEPLATPRALARSRRAAAQRSQ